MNDLECRAYLRTLPMAEPPPALWARLRQAQVRRQHRPWRWSALAAAVVVSLLAVWALPRPGSAPSSVPITASAGTIDPALRQVDLELGLAYARHAGEDEIAALWQTRARLLAQANPAAPVVLARL
jgi:hypothetical protein